LTQRDVWLLRTDSLGDTLWTRQYGGTDNDVGSDIVGLPDGGFAFAGYTYSFSGEPGTRRDGWLVRLAPNGDTLWTRTFAGVHGQGGTFASVRLLPDGGFLMGGTDDALNGEGWVVQTDSLGNLVWQDAWGDITKENWDHITYAEPTRDGGCIAFGCSYTYATPSFDAWMLKIDSLCRIGVEETPDTGVRIANPLPTVARGVLLLPELVTRSNLPERNSVLSRAVLLDAAGRKVMELAPGANDVSRLAPGVYFVHSVANNGLPDRKVVIQH